MRARGRRAAGGAIVRAAALLGLAFGLLLFDAAGASAAFNHKEEFSEAGGNVPTFDKPMALTVDPASGDLLVVDGEADSISRFKPNGEPDPFSALSSNVIDGEGGADETPSPHGLDFGTNPREVQIAVAPPGAAGGTAGDIYVTQSSRRVIYVFASDGEYLEVLSEFNEGADASGAAAKFGSTAGVAVDPAGAVFIGDLNNAAVHKYVPSSNPVTNADNTANFPRPPTAGLVAAGAEATNGFIFATHFGNQPAKLDSATGDEQYVVDSGESIGLAVDGGTGHLFNASEFEVKEWDASGPTEAKLVSHFQPCVVAGVAHHIRGLAVDGSRELAYFSCEGVATIEVWERVKVPEARTLAAAPVSSAGATLRGEVNPNGLPLSECFFEWGETTGYGNLAPCEEPDAAEVGDGILFEPVHAAVALEPGTEYHFRLVAGNENTTPATNVKGADETLTTLGAQIRDESASQITATDARIGASIDPRGEAVSFFVEYLPEAAYLANPAGERFAGALKAPAFGRPLPATVSGDGQLSLLGEGHGSLTAGSKAVTNLSFTAKSVFSVGESISGAGIPEGTTIAGALTGPNGVTELTLSNAATQSGVAVPFVSGSRVVTAVSTTAGRFGPGQAISGPGIPPGTTIVAVRGAGELELSNGVTERVEGAALTATGPQPVFQQLAGLAPGVAYRYRVVAVNAATAFGATEGFRTFGPPPTALPDGRAYEMVSPPQKAGEVIPPLAASARGLGKGCFECLPGVNWAAIPMQSAPDGRSVLYEGQPFAAGLAAGPNEYVSARGASGWDWRSLNAPTMTGQWDAFSSDLSRGILAQGGLPREPPLTPEAPTRGGLAFSDLYLSAGGRLQPLITVEPPHRDPGSGPNEFVARYAGANPGAAGVQPFGHVVFEADDALTGKLHDIAPEAPAVEASAGCSFPESTCNLYEWTAGWLRLVNVLPGNDLPASGSVIGSGALLLEGNRQRIAAPDVDHAISDDGSRIFWSSQQTGQVYARVDGVETLPVQGPGTCKGSVPLPERACFLTASADGSKVLLANGSVDALNEGAHEYEQALDLTAGQGGFQGILGAAEDLTRVYFVDTVALTGAEANPQGEDARAGAFNLYVWEHGDTRFIGVLAATDNKFGNNSRFGAWHAAPSNRTAQTTFDGGYLAFMSTAPLTGYDSMVQGGGICNEGQETSEPCPEVFEYAAATRTLKCVSCNPSGQRPLGPSNLSLLRPDTSFPQPGNLSRAGGGRLFFESSDALTPQDTNGSVRDVYEWEPDGVGSCRSDADEGGCVSLISSGHGAGESFFLDSTPSGDDAFLVTREQLLTQDENHQIDLYDARVGGGFNEATPPACGGEACKGSVNGSPSQPSSGSSGFVGSGNPKQAKNCAKPARQAKSLSRRAARLRHHAKRAADPGKATQLRKQAAQLARRARQKSNRAKTCRGASGKGGSPSRLQRRARAAHRRADRDRRAGR